MEFLNLNNNNRKTVVYPAYEMSTTVGILTFMSRINFMLSELRMIKKSFFYNISV